MEKNRVLFFISHLIYNLILFIITILITKLLGPEKWGEITLFSLIATYSGIFTLGINNGMGITLPIHIGKKNNLFCIKVLSSSKASLVLSFIPIILFQFILLNYLNFSLNEVFILFFFTISIQILGYFKIFLRSYELFRVFSYTYLIQTFSLIFGLLIMKENANYLIILTFANLSASTFIGLNKFYIKSNWKIDKGIFIKIFHIGFPVMMAGIIGELLLSIDRLLISIFLDNYQLGLYGFGSNFFKGIRIIGIAVSIITLPRIAKSYAKKNRAQMIYHAKIQQWLSFALMLIASFISGILIFNYLPVLMPNFSGSINISIILLSVATILPLSFYPNILNIIGKQKLYLFTQIFIILFNLTISSIFIILGYGIEGVAYGSLISMIFYVIILRYFGNRAFKKLKF
ncbi:MAG: oligosaccharide flippase family protein [Candidatus Neomarinimicrobiota bacterium]